MPAGAISRTKLLCLLRFVLHDLHSMNEATSKMEIITNMWISASVKISNSIIRLDLFNPWSQIIEIILSYLLLSMRSISSVQQKKMTYD